MPKCGTGMGFARKIAWHESCMQASPGPGQLCPTMTFCGFGTILVKTLVCMIEQWAGRTSISALRHFAVTHRGIVTKCGIDRSLRFARFFAHLGGFFDLAHVLMSLSSARKASPGSIDRRDRATELERAVKALAKGRVNMDIPANRLPYETFFRKAILAGRDLSRGKGLHVVFSGLKQAFMKHYQVSDKNAMRGIIDRLCAEGKLAVRPAKGGALIYLPEDAPAEVAPRENLLDKLLALDLNAGLEAESTNGSNGNGHAEETPKADEKPIETVKESRKGKGAKEERTSV